MPDTSRVASLFEQMCGNDRAAALLDHRRRSVRLTPRRGEYILFPVVKTREHSTWRSRLEKLIRGHIRQSVKDRDMREAMNRG